MEKSIFGWENVYLGGQIVRFGGQFVHLSGQMLANIFAHREQITTIMRYVL